MSIVFILVAYFIGSIPFSLLLVRWTRGIDLRQFGSGNIGASNARRAAGFGWGIVALLGDALKGALPVLAVIFSGIVGWKVHPDWTGGIAAVAAIFGHMFPVYFLFKPSGKGVATTIGSFLILAPKAVGIMVVLAVVVIVFSRRISLGSMTAVVALPVAIVAIYQAPFLVGCSLVTMVAILFRHKDNIRRLVRGEEPKLGKG